MASAGKLYRKIKPVFRRIYAVFVLLVFTFGLAVLLLELLPSQGEPTTITTTSTGFSRIKPQLGGVGFYKNGSFESVFTNYAGKNITIDEVGLTIEMGGKPCQFYTVKTFGWEGETLNGSLVAPGENFRITAICPIKIKDEYKYEAKITIPYTIENKKQKDEGIIKGPLEECFRTPEC